MADVKIILVEDDAIEAMDIKETVESFGYSVSYVASRGEEAVSKALELMPDLVLMDIILKGELDGIEAASKIRKLNIPIIYLTAHSEEPTIKKAKLTEPYGYLIKPYDVSELRFAIELALFKSKQEKKLKESEENFRAMAENASEGILIAVDKGTHVYANQMAVEITGYNIEELLKTSITDLVHQDEINEIMDKYKARMAGKILPATYGTRIERKDGTIIPIEVTTAKTTWIGQKAIMAIFRDISKRKNDEEEFKRAVEKELRESEEFNYLTLSNISDAVFITDSEGKFIFICPNIDVIFGYSFLEVEKMGKISKLFGEGELFKPAELERLGEIRNIEHDIIDKTGETHNLLVNIKKVSIKGGKYLYTCHDITERKKAEDALKKSQAELELRVEERTNELKKVNCELREEIEGHRRAEKALKNSEDKLHLKLDSILSPEVDIEEEELSNIIDKEALQSLMDEFFAVTEMGIGIIDLKGNVLVGTGWQDICIKFHRVNPKTCKNCIESDLILSRGVKPGDFRAYKCKNNLWDIVTPIFIGDKHVGNVFLGQFFYEDEVPDWELFEEQADKYGFNKEEYLTALNTVPRWSRNKVENLMRFYAKFAAQISKLGYSNLKLAKTIVEKEKTEKELELASLYNRSLIEASLDPLVTIGPDGKITDVNGATERVTGCSRSKLIGTDFSDYFTEPDKAREGYEQVFKEGFVRDYPLEINDKDGNITSVLYNASLYKDESGEVVGVFAAARDISEIRKAEEKIQLLADVVESSDDAIIAKSLDGRITSWNKGAESIYGYSSGEIIGKDISILAPPELKNEIKILIENIKHDKHVLHYETTRVRKDGEEITVSLTLSPVYDSLGDLVGISTIARDITESKKHENAIIRAKEEWENTFNAVPDLIAILDTNYHVVRTNKAMADKLGVTPQEAIGFTCYDVVHGLNEPPSFCPNRKLLADGQEHKAEIHEDRLGGDFIVSVSPLYDSDGKLMGSVHVARDITDRKRAEDEVKKSLKEKEALLSEIHHRVKNNMQIISSLLNIQSQYVKEEESVDVLHESQDRVKAMATIYEKLYLSEDLNKINFKNYIQSLVQGLFYSHAVPESQIISIIEIEDIMLNIETAVPCGLIISELISNSLKHAFPDGRKGEVMVSLQAYDGKYDLRISDNGIGFPDEIDFKNTNTLGLQLVNNLVQQIDGKITLDKSHGTEFRVIFEELEYKKRF